MDGIHAYPTDGRWSRGAAMLDMVDQTILSFASCACLAFIVREEPNLAYVQAARAAHIADLGLAMVDAVEDAQAETDAYRERGR